MKNRCQKILLSLCAFAGLGFASANAEAPPTATAARPNIIFILCDDLGFGDTGPTFQLARAALNNPSQPSFSTPGLDAFAAQGLVLRNHYCPAPVCAPSRASLLTGVTQGHASVRNNMFDYALANNHTLATVLKQAGYSTAAFGKWGLQGLKKRAAKADAAESEESENAPDEQKHWTAYPTKRGFDYYFGYVRHGDGHFHYPKEDKKEIWENAETLKRDDLDLCYTTDLFTARAKKWIVDHQAASAGKPFFIYLAYDTPHAKLQYAPSAYPAGRGLKGGLQWLGQPGKMINSAEGKYDGWCHPDYAKATYGPGAKPWPEMQKRFASSVRRIDECVDDVVQLLKDLNLDQNTLIVFTSDNGPSKESYFKGQGYSTDFFRSAGPHSGIKRDVIEGGVRVPTLVRWPAAIPAGKVSRSPSGFWDWMVTFAEVAGVPAPAASDGVSIVPTLTQQGKQRPGTIYVEYAVKGKSPNGAYMPAHLQGRDRDEMQMVQVGPYTGVRYGILSHKEDFEIYDVEKDPSQSKNLAKEPGMAELQTKMKARVLQQRMPNPDAPRPYDDIPVPAVTPTKKTDGKIYVATYEGNWPWMPEFKTLKQGPVKNGTAIALSELPETENFGAAFVGLLKVDETGEYTFHADTDAGSQLFIHDARVIDDDFARTGAEVSGKIRLAAGYHPIRFYYRHLSGPRKLQLEYSGPGISRQPVPASALALP